MHGTDPPPVTELCCDVKRRVPCRLKDIDLDKDPYTCRQLGCCYDGSGEHKPDYQPSYGGKRRRKRRRPKKYGRPRYRAGYGYGYGYGYGEEDKYGDGYENEYWPPKNQPRCFKTRRSKQPNDFPNSSFPSFRNRVLYVRVLIGLGRALIRLFFTHAYSPFVLRQCCPSSDYWRL